MWHISTLQHSNDGQSPATIGSVLVTRESKKKTVAKELTKNKLPVLNTTPEFNLDIG